MLLADAGPRRYGLLEAVERLLGADRARGRRAPAASSRKGTPAGFLARAGRFVSYPFRAFRRRVGA